LSRRFRERALERLAHHAADEMGNCVRQKGTAEEMGYEMEPFHFSDRCRRRDLWTESALAEFAEHGAAVDASVVVEGEDLLLPVDADEHLLAIDFVVGAHRLRHHRDVDRVARHEFELIHDEAVAHTAALRQVGSAEAVTASGYEKTEQRCEYDRFHFHGCS
jgi:hypothetical protein